ncbi:hypothetical protein H0264_09340 [Nocardia huaxiensis]|uniref:Uncharacterized protein n=1 Tax=Nocardia huaxiensis TaxID=2755382 RepID=A0A7D6VD65_9NOCA|nr:hypothetical protein [Nocardia huaxiensis]QLY32431.1 hypothetical protein H0264_09340 [Nocardia huaxiensis]
MAEKLENFLLHELSDDWVPIATFDGFVARIAPERYSREGVIDVIRELADKGYIRFGAFPGGGRSWEPWDVSIEEAIQRISFGYKDIPGYLTVSDDEIGSNEVFRADLLPPGERRLADLGHPYEKYGDPWQDTPRHVHD